MGSIFNIDYINTLFISQNKLAINKKENLSGSSDNTPRILYWEDRERILRGSQEDLEGISEGFQVDLGSISGGSNMLLTSTHVIQNVSQVKIKLQVYNIMFLNQLQQS